MPADPRQWRIVIDGGPLTSFEEFVNLLRDAGYHVLSPPEKAVLDAGAAIPDITLSRWACTPGHHWEPLRAALKALRRSQGFDVDAEIDAFDGQGQLRSRPQSALRQHAPAPDYRLFEEDDS